MLGISTWSITYFVLFKKLLKKLEEDDNNLRSTPFVYIFNLRIQNFRLNIWSHI